MTNNNNEFTIQVGDQCRVLEDNPYDADIFEGDIVTVSSVTGDGISVLDDRNIEWHLDESKVEPIGTNELDEEEAVDFSLKIGDRCRVTEDFPDLAYLTRGEEVTVTVVYGDTVVVADDEGNGWDLDPDKIEPIGINELDNENRVIELPENFEITDKKGNKFIAKREQDPKIFPGIIDVEERFLDGKTHFALPYDELSKGSQYVITKYAEKPTLEVDLGEVADDVISDLGEHLSESDDDFYLYVADKVVEESKERDFDEYYREAESLKTERVYLAGPISTEGDVMYMSYLAEELRNLGYHVHAPHEDESINDKTNDPSADDIFANDTDAIDISDIVVLVESGREQVGTHMEAGKIIERIEQGAHLELVVFTSNYRVEDTQIEDGKASASVNHYALGGYKRAGTWVDGMSAGMLEYMKERKYPQEVGYEYDCEKEFQKLPDEEFGIFEGDTIVKKDGSVKLRVKKVYEDFIDTKLLNTDLEAREIVEYDEFIENYLKQLEDGRLINYSAEIVYKDNEHAKEDGIHVE